MVKVRVLVADEQTLFRECVRTLLEIREDIEVVGEATNGQETIEKVREQTPDVVLIDIDMSVMDGAEVTHHIHKENSEIKVLLLAEYEDKERILSGLKAGANGYIPKRATASDLVSAIQAVYQGSCFLYPSVATIVVNDYLQRINHPGSPALYDKLTYRERAVLRLVVEGYKSREIANLLTIAFKTTLRHRASIMKTLGIHSQAELIKYAIRKHLVDLYG